MKKPLHHHIRHHAKRAGHHVKKAGKRVTKYLAERDTIFATIWVFIFIFGLGAIPLNLKFLNPIKLSLKDFDFNDLAYAKLKKGKDNPPDDRIVIINIGDLDREGLAMLIEKTASYQPKIMGLDVLLAEARDPVKDSLFRATISKYENLVMATKLNPDSVSEPLSRGYFGNSFRNEGYVTFVADDPSTVRLWLPFEKIKDKRYPSFATALIKGYDTESYQKLEKRHHDLEIINYTRRVEQYQVLEPDWLFQNLIEDSSVIKGRIALLGYINLDPDNILDKKFTPMNKKYYGKSTPDMNGIVVHANMISMVLDKNYIKKLPSWLNILFAVLIGWLHMSFFIHYYLESHIWFHLAAKIAQVASAIFFVYLGIYMFDQYRIKISTGMTLLTIVLAVDVIYFYEAWAVWMHRKFKYKTVFHAHGHGDGGHHGHGHTTHAKPDEEIHHEKHHDTPIPGKPNENSDHHS